MNGYLLPSVIPARAHFELDVRCCGTTFEEMSDSSTPKQSLLDPGDDREHLRGILIYGEWYHSGRSLDL